MCNVNVFNQPVLVKTSMLHRELAKLFFLLRWTTRSTLIGGQSLVSNVMEGGKGDDTANITNYIVVRGKRIRSVGNDNIELDNQKSSYWTG